MSGYDFGVVEGVDEGVAVLLLKLDGFLIGVVIDSRHEAHFGTEAFGGFDFGDGCAGGEAYERFDAVVGGCECHALCMVAGGACYHTFGPLLGGELRDFIIGSTELEGSCVLEVFGLEIDV